MANSTVLVQCWHEFTISQLSCQHHISQLSCQHHISTYHANYITTTHNIIQQHISHHNTTPHYTTVRLLVVQHNQIVQQKTIRHITTTTIYNALMQVLLYWVVSQITTYNNKNVQQKTNRGCIGWYYVVVSMQYNSTCNNNCYNRTIQL